MVSFPFLLSGEPRVATIVIVPLGSVRAKEIDAVRRALVRTYHLQVMVGARRTMPRETYYPPRARYRAERLIAWLAKGGPGDKVIGVTREDISTTAHGHKDWGIAGRALLGGRSAVVSSFRAKARIGDVAVHEIGHTLGLPHCPHLGCIMQDANGKIARIGTRFCLDCHHCLALWLR